MSRLGEHWLQSSGRYVPSQITTSEVSLLIFFAVNGHTESYYSTKTGQWTEPTFIADPYLKIHGMAPALNYGQQAFEGIKAFRMPGDNAIAIFRPDKNSARMAHSAGFVAIPPVPDDVFLKACRKL